jgi:zinc D-Ala-D-Ala carboxypeptidase
MKKQGIIYFLISCSLVIIFSHYQVKAADIQPQISTIQPQISNPQISNPQISNIQISNLQTLDSQLPDLQNPDSHLPELQNPDVQNPDVQNPDVQNPDLKLPKPETPNLQTPDLEQCAALPKSFNHYPYQEASRGLLVSIGSNQKLHPQAAKAFREMQKAARSSGIYLKPVSGFRSISQQQYLFYGVAKQRKQTLAQRAKVSAPPGHSQHHTGYAIDINSLKQSFDRTKEFAWLQRNAETYGFQMSFPPNNPQGIMYEPWHWAWHGSEEAKIALHSTCKDVINRVSTINKTGWPTNQPPRQQ